MQVGDVQVKMMTVMMIAGKENHKKYIPKGY